MSVSKATRTTHQAKKPAESDAAIGRRLRARRQQLGLSQEKVAQSLGVSFQQVQKYESGVNRVSASRLNQFAQIFGVDMEFFYANVTPSMLQVAEAKPIKAPRQQPVNTELSAELLKVFYALPDDANRYQAIDIIKSMLAKAKK